MALIIILGLLTLAGLIWFVRNQRAKAQRDELLQTPLIPEHVDILIRNVPLYNRLPEALREPLQGCISYFLAEKVFVGCDGFVITDEVRLTIAGNACLLVLSREKKYFPGFETILVYPDTYVAKEVRYDGMIAVYEESTRAGESWHRGPIVLSWADVKRGSGTEHDGHNVVLHEFAHKLDEENTVMDGLPVLREREHYQEWASVLTREYDAFMERVEGGTNDVIDEYGAVSAPEFFAVATESFFEKAQLMQAKLPDLYRQFQTFYGLDPTQWGDG